MCTAPGIASECLAGRRDEVVIATKFGYTFDAGWRAITGVDTSPAYVRRACVASLGRLGTDRIDVYPLHVGDLPFAQAQERKSWWARGWFAVMGGAPMTAAGCRVRRWRALRRRPARAERP